MRIDVFTHDPLHHRGTHQILLDGLSSMHYAKRYIADAAKEPDRVDKRMAKAKVGADYMVVSGFANRDVNGKVVEIEPFISCETKSSSFFNSKPACPSSTSIGSKSSASN